MAFLFNRKNENGKKSGFPWLSLSIIILTWAVLGAIATPNFRKGRERANQRAAYANMKTVAGAIEMYNLDNGVTVNQLTPSVWQNLRSQGYLQTIPDDPGFGPGSHMNYKLDKNGDIYSTQYGGIQSNPDGSQRVVNGPSVTGTPASSLFAAGRQELRQIQLAKSQLRSNGWQKTNSTQRQKTKTVTKIIKVKRTSWLGPALVTERREIVSVPAEKKEKPREPVELDPSARPFKMTYVEPHSTFAMDVDTASYTQMRQQILAGKLPPVERVRPEEYVNYFDHEYGAPDHETFALYSTCAPSPYRAEVLLLEVGIKAREVKKENRRPTSITAVVDTSGSMSTNDRLIKVKQALKLLVNELKEGDTFALVEYSTYALTVLKPIAATRKQTINNAIDRLHTRGGTNVYKGLEKGYEVARETYSKERNNRVIICSDGMANSGYTSANQILSEIGEDGRRGIYLTCVGVGMGGYNDELMEKLADKGNGTCSYIDTVDEARRIFCEGLTSTLETVARDAKIQVEFDKKIVYGHRLVGYKNRLMAAKDFRNDKVDAGEVGAGHSVTAIYELLLNKPLKSLAGSFDKLATVRVRFKDAVKNKVTEYQEEVTGASFYRDINTAPARFRLSAAVVRYAEVLRNRQIDERKIANQLCRDTCELSSLLADDKAVVEFAEIVERARDLMFGHPLLPFIEINRASD